MEEVFKAEKRRKEGIQLHNQKTGSRYKNIKARMGRSRITDFDACQMLLHETTSSSCLHCVTFVVLQRLSFSLAGDVPSRNVLVVPQVQACYPGPSSKSMDVKR